MADLVTTIKVDSKQFDNSIKSSTNQVRKFEQDNKKAGKGVEEFGGKISSIASGALTGMAGTLGLAMGAMEVFNGSMRSTQGTSDAFDKVIAQAKGSVDYFFQAVATGDWSNFWDGLDGAIRRAGDLAVAMDYLGDIQAAWNDKSSENVMKIEENRAELQETGTSKKRKEELIAENKTLIAALTIDAKKANLVTEDVVNKMVESFANVDGITEKEVSFYLRNPLDDDPEFKKYVEGVKKLEAASKETSTVSSSSTVGGYSQTIQTDEARLAEKQLALYKEKNKNGIYEGKQINYEKQRMIDNKVLDDEREKLVAERIAMRNRNVSIANKQRQLAKDEKRVDGSDGLGAGTKLRVEPIIPKESLADLDKQIRELDKKISLSIDDGERRKLDQEIAALNAKKVIIKFSYKYEGSFNPNDRIENNPYATVAKGMDRESAKGVKIKAPAVSNIGESISSMQQWNDTMNKVREDNWGTIESFNGISTALSGISSASEGSASAMFRWLASTVGAIGQAIPLIMALTTAKEVEATANAKVAVTGVAASVSSIPIVGPILALGAVASIIAAMSAIPKFAEGGLVYGNTIAQVGEYAGASNNPEVIAPLSKLRKILSDTNEGNGVGGSVDFRISGKDLAGTLQNYSSKQRKK